MSLYDAASTAGADGHKCPSVGDEGTIADAERALAMKSGPSVRLRCGGGGACKLCCAATLLLAALLAAYLSSAASAAQELAAGANAKLKLTSSTHMCGGAMRLGGEVQITNPSSWAASLEVEEFRVLDGRGVVTNRAGAADFKPGVLQLPAGETSHIPITIDLAFVDVEAMGAMMHRAYANGELETTVELQYTARLSGLPFGSGGALEILLSTSGGGGGSGGGGEAPAAGAAAGGAAGTGAGDGAPAAEGGGAKVVAVDRLQFGASVLSVSPPLAADSPEAFAISANLNISASWDICLLLHTFALPAVRLLASTADGQPFATFEVSRYQLAPSYDQHSNAHSQLQAWVRLEVTAEQVPAARRMMERMLPAADGSVGEAVAVGLAVDAGECSALRVVGMMVGRFNTSLSPLALDPDAASTAAPNTGAASGREEEPEAEATGGLEGMNPLAMLGVAPQPKPLRVAIAP